MSVILILYSLAREEHSIVQLLQQVAFKFYSPLQKTLSSSAIASQPITAFQQGAAQTGARIALNDGQFLEDLIQ